MITLPLCPPKPKLLEIVGPGSHGRGAADDDVDAEVDVDGVGGRRDLPVLERQQHGRRLECPGGAEGVSGDTLDRRHRRAGLTEHLEHGFRLGSVVERRRRPVSVDLADVGRLQASVLEGQLHAHDRPRAAG